MFLCTNFWWTSSIVLVQGGYLSHDLFWEEEQVCMGMWKEGIWVIFLLLPSFQTPSAWAIFYPRVSHFGKLYPEPHPQLTPPHLFLLPETTAKGPAQFCFPSVWWPHPGCPLSGPMWTASAAGLQTLSGFSLLTCIHPHQTSHKGIRLYG